MHKITATIAVGIAAAGLTVGATTGAVASRLIGSADVRDDSIRSVDVHDGTLKGRDLRPSLLDRLAKPGPAGADGTDGRDGVDGARGPQGPAGAQGPAGPAGPAGATGPQGPAGADGTDGRDGVANVTTGAHYRSEWAPGDQLNETITSCPDGQTILGGGYSTFGGKYDLGGDNPAIQVTVSAPYFAGEYVPVNEGGSFRGDIWVVRGYNHGDTPQVVRAWAICADVN